MRRNDASATTAPEAAEEDLLHRLRQGNREAYREAVERYSPKMLGAARRIVGPDQAEDIGTRAPRMNCSRLAGTFYVQCHAGRRALHPRASGGPHASADVRALQAPLRASAEPGGGTDHEPTVAIDQTFIDRLLQRLDSDMNEPAGPPGP